MGAFSATNWKPNRKIKRFGECEQKTFSNSWHYICQTGD
jgi:hypothetical protein